MMPLPRRLQWPRWHQFLVRDFSRATMVHQPQTLHLPCPASRFGDINIPLPSLLHPKVHHSFGRGWWFSDVADFGIKRCGLLGDIKSSGNNIFQFRLNSSYVRIPRMSDCQTIEEATDAIYDNLDIAAARDLAAFWCVVPRLLQRGGRNRKTERRNNNHAQQMQKQLDEILVRTIEDVQSFRYRDLAQTTLAFAKIAKKVEGNERRNPIGSPDRILREMFIGQNNENKKFIFGCMAQASEPILQEFDPRHLSNLIYAFGLVKYNFQYQDGSTFFDVLGEEAIPSLGKFIPQGLSNVVWAYANIGVSNVELFEKAGEVVSKRDSLEDFKPQELSNIVWAYATAKESHPKLFIKVGDHIGQLDSLEDFWPQALANIMWSYATVKESHPKLFKKVGDHIVRLDNLQSFNGQALSNIVWSYATSKESNPKLFEKVGDHVVQLDNLQRFKPQAIANILWSYATAKISNPDLFQKVAKAAIENQKEFDAQGITNLLWAFATNGQLDHRFFKSLSPAAVALVDKCSSQGLTTIAWAYAVADMATPSLFNDAFVNACAKKEHDFISEELRQLHQWTLWQKELKSNVRLPVSLEKKCYDAFISREPSPSALQNDVATQLKAIGLEPEEEVLTESGYRIDAIVKMNENRVAVEVDGPSHFIGRKQTGSTILKHRQIASLDELRVVSVPYWEWNELKEESNKKQEYLHSLLSFDSTK